MLKKITTLTLASAMLLSVPHWAQAFPKGFLTQDQLPNSLSLLPAPPAYGSISFLRDRANYDAAIALRDAKRMQQAVSDADLTAEHFGHSFSQALGVTISPENTPITNNLLNRLGGDTDAASDFAKAFYNRVRPFVLFNSHSCTPNLEDGMINNGSYPSGHTSFGWATVLVLAEIRPERQQQLFKRGYEFGKSRTLCRAHWQSDVDAGYLIGAAVVARLQSSPAFQAEFAKAKQEIQQLVNKQAVSQS